MATTRRVRVVVCRASADGPWGVGKRVVRMVRLRRSVLATVAGERVQIVKCRHCEIGVLVCRPGSSGRVVLGHVRVSSGRSSKAQASAWCPQDLYGWDDRPFLAWSGTVHRRGTRMGSYFAALRSVVTTSV